MQLWCLVVTDPGFFAGFSGSGWIITVGLRCYIHFLVSNTLILQPSTQSNVTAAFSKHSQFGKVYFFNVPHGVWSFEDADWSTLSTASCSSWFDLYTFLFPVNHNYCLSLSSSTSRILFTTTFVISNEDASAVPRVYHWSDFTICVKLPYIFANNSLHSTLGVNIWVFVLCSYKVFQMLHMIGSMWWLYIWNMSHRFTQWRFFDAGAISVGVHKRRTILTL